MARAPFDKVPPSKPEASAKPCPICGKAPDPDMSPFCSKRCADVDLHRWLGGVYAVPDDNPAAGEIPKDDSER